MPAYNAAKTLHQTYEEVMEQGMVDPVILVDDASCDETARIAVSLPRTKVHVHEKNRGYGGNQKTCYRLALEAGGDIIIAEVSSPTKYFKEAFSIDFGRSMTYGWGCLRTAVLFRLSRMKLMRSPLFAEIS